jgi:AcrR family transcriptional regulator
MDRRQERGQTTRQQILSVATRLFTDPGYEATSIDMLLNACNISRGAFYHHFASKELLFEAVYEAIEQEITANSAQAAVADVDPVERLRGGCRRFLEAARSESFRRIGLIDAPAVLGWRKWREIESRHGLGALKAGLSQAIESRGGRPDGVNEAAHLLLAALCEAAMLIARAEDPDRSRKMAMEAIDRFIDGVVRS